MPCVDKCVLEEGLSRELHKGLAQGTKQPKDAPQGRDHREKRGRCTQTCGNASLYFTLQYSRRQLCACHRLAAGLKPRQRDRLAGRPSG